MGYVSSALLVMITGAALGACGTGARAVIDRNDATLPRAVIGSPGWEYARIASGDFDGDGVAERAVLLARVTLRNGEPVWEDWNVWQVYVEESTGERTYVYSAPVQLGQLEPTVTIPDAAGRSSIVLVEHTPQSVAMYEVVYGGPGDARLMAIAERTVNAGAGFVAPEGVGTSRR
ncbi:MAG TPA: hypothetical protein VNA88_04270 [Candidatus Kapabacteria bacterium]|jgi:hypothetical protein|nr:hypothetical protein [Candidatus Kapabacteria bacterium]HVK37724.1 hypothetical protein [Candidatus Kapabacteria bacterium]